MFAPPAAVARAARCAEDFRGDLAELADVMRRSWADGPGRPALYTPELLADHLRHPAAASALTPSIYDRDALAAFVAGQPRHVLIAGVPRRIVIATLLTVAAEHKGSGYGIVVWGELMRRAAALGFEGGVSYCVAGGPMDRMIAGSCRLLGLPLVRVKSFSYLVRAGVPDQAHPAARRADADQLVGAAARVRAGVRRVWTEAEADWQLSRLGAVSVAGDAGTLTGTVLTLDDAARTRCLAVDDVLWRDAGGDASRARHVRDLLCAASRCGATVAVLPLLGYADVHPFLDAGFLPMSHTMHAYLTLWADPPAARPVDGYYLDVI